MPSIAALALVMGLGATPTGDAPYIFIEGKIPEKVQPDGNSILLEGPSGMLVIDTGRHPEHTDKIIAAAKARNKPITAIINTHWHLDHATGNARIRAAYPGTQLYTSTAVEGALKGFLIRNVDKAKARLDDPNVPESSKADTRLYLGAINDPANLIPDQPVNGPMSLKLGERELRLHLARHAATEGDVWVHDPASKTVFVGDLVVVPLPFFDTGCAEGWRQALAEIDRVDFETLVPGHGLPMNHATFSSYRRAFDAFTACAESPSPTASCVATWMQEGAPFVAMHPDPKYSQAALTYYVDQVLRVPGKRAEYCSPRTAPLADYHQHLVSPAFAPIVKLPERDGASLVRELDAAGIERAVVHSVGYSFADERKNLNDPDRLTREQNDWTSAEVTRHPSRLIGFCSANPHRTAALQELERCLALPGMAGIKLHLGNSGISLRDPAHLALVQGVFGLAQRRASPVLVHMRARGGSNYGAKDAHIFLDKVVPMAPDSEIIVAHLGASGPGYPSQNDEVMEVFAAAAARQDQRMRNLYFDVATNVTEDITPADALRAAQRIRQVGVARVLYGSDLGPPGGSIRRGWEIFRTKVPLTAQELQQIAGNRTRFLR